MTSDMAQAAEKTGMKRIEAHVPDLYSFKSIVCIAVCFLGPLVLAHLVNLIGWWVPLVSTAVWDTLGYLDGDRAGVSGAELDGLHYGIYGAPRMLRHSARGG